MGRVPEVPVAARPCPCPEPSSLTTFASFTDGPATGEQVSLSLRAGLAVDGQVAGEMFLLLRKTLSGS